MNKSIRDKGNILNLLIESKEITAEYMKEKYIVNIEGQKIGLDIKEISSDTKFWLIRTNSGAFYDEYRRDNFIALGWNNIDEKVINKLLKCEKDKYKEEFERIKQDIIDIWGVDTRIATTILNKSIKFKSQIKEGDIIMFPNKGSNELTFAIACEYYEVDNLYEKEIEVLNKLDDERYSYFNISCPFKKRRKIKIIKTVKHNRIHPKLLQALYSRHGISDITDYAEYTLSTIYTLYNWDNRICLSLRIEQDGRIYGYEYSVFMYYISKLIKESDENIEYTTRSNLNSKGIVECILGLGSEIADTIGTYPIVLICIGIILLICGGKYGKLEVNSILDKIANYKKSCAEIKAKDIETEILKEDLRAKKIDNDIKEIEFTKIVKETQDSMNKSVEKLKVNKKELMNVMFVEQKSNE